MSSTGVAADALDDIRNQVLRQARVMEWVRALTVSHRLTGSPAMDAAGEWVEKQLKEIGLSNVHVERWPFERRWTARGVDLAVVEPQALTIPAIAQTWSPGTNGVQTGPLRKMRASDEARLTREAERLRGAFVLVADPGR